MPDSGIARAMSLLNELPEIAAEKAFRVRCSLGLLLLLEVYADYDGGGLGGGEGEGEGNTGQQNQSIGLHT